MSESPFDFRPGGAPPRSPDADASDRSRSGAPPRGPDAAHGRRTTGGARERTRPEPERVERETLPGKAWGRKLVREAERSVSHLRRPLKKATKEARSAATSTHVLEGRAQAAQRRYDTLKDKLDYREGKIDDLKDPEALLNRIPYVRRINAARIRWHRWKEKRVVNKMDRARRRAIEATGAHNAAKETFTELNERRLRLSQAIETRIGNGLAVIDGRLSTIDERITKLEAGIARHEQVMVDAVTKVENLRVARREARTEEEFLKIDAAMKVFENARKNSERALKRQYDAWNRARAHRGRMVSNRAIVEAGVEKIASTFDIQMARGSEDVPDLDVPRLPRGAASRAEASSPSSLDLSLLLKDYFPEVKLTPQSMVEKWNQLYPYPQSTIRSAEELLQFFKEAGQASPDLELNAFVSQENSVEDWQKELELLYEKHDGFRNIVDNARDQNIDPKQHIQNFLTIIRMDS